MRKQLLVGIEGKPVKKRVPKNENQLS